MSFVIKPISTSKALADEQDFVDLINKAVFIGKRSYETNSQNLFDKVANKTASKDEILQLSQNLGFATSKELFQYFESISTKTNNLMGKFPFLRDQEKSKSIVRESLEILIKDKKLSVQNYKGLVPDCELDYLALCAACTLNYEGLILAGMDYNSAAAIWGGCLTLAFAWYITCIGA